jgi:PAS domain S-box-containing protein
MWSSSFHRPFTTLSPTVSSKDPQELPTAKDQSLSDVSTPAASVTSFMPPGTSATTFKEDPRYPSPNLYELVLRLNSEPGLDLWWETLCRIMYESYGVERMSLAIPADAGELENVPWGQKATFNLNGIPASHHFQLPKLNEKRQADQPLRNILNEGSDPSSISGSNSGRPKLPSRHSYTGYERAKNDPNLSQSPTSPSSNRPRLSRATSNAPHTISFMQENIDGNSERLPLITSLKQLDKVKSSAFSDLDFSISGESEKQNGPYHYVLPMLRALNFEARALLDDAGVNRIIDRGKLVALTRNYSSEATPLADSVTSKQQKNTMSGNQSPGQTQMHSANLSDGQMLAEKRLKMATDFFNRSKTIPAYEEYEQFPTSPWSQSPAPSPAVQVDPEENPFFDSGIVDEDSFNPSDANQDYSQYGHVEAIGVDKASTIIHLPLIHPILSQDFPPRTAERDSETPTNDYTRSKLTTATDHTTIPSNSSPRQTPQAIISFLCPVVPYPHNLLQSLKLLSPHLATSFSMAQQYSSAHNQSSGMFLRLSSGNGVGFSPLGDTSMLEHLMEAGLDTPNNSTTGSINSPSEYSSRSRQSPIGSLVGTPAWDPSSMVFSNRQSIGSTPGLAGLETVDSYFDAKKRTPTTRNESGSRFAPVQQTTERESPTVDRRPRSMTGPSNEENKPTKSESRSIRPVTQDEKGFASSHRDLSPSRHGRTGSPKRKAVVTRIPERKQHTLLHSYGADFTSTFQSLPATATPINRAPGYGPTSGLVQGEETMPPPSERLLRTIIDSLPVQIFTAAPGTGDLTWVNSRFLVYRGQDRCQILHDPWQSVHPDDKEHYMDHWRKSLNTGQQFCHKVRLLRFDNEYRWFYVRATPLKDRKQKIVHWAGTNMDIHEQHIAELHAARQQETAASEAKYRSLANSSPQIVFAVNRVKGIIFCNTQWTTYSGQTEAQALGIGFMEYVHPDDLAKCRLPSLNKDGTLAVDVPTSLPPEVHRYDSSKSFSDDSSETSRTVTSPEVRSPSTVALPQAKLSKLASQGILKVSKDADGRPSYSTEVRLRSKDGQHRWHLVRVLLSEPLRNDKVDDETWYGTCTDINDHKMLERTLKDTMDAKSRFLSNMSHEIRTPLNGITGMVNFLIDSNLSTEQMEHVNIIRASTEGLRDLINDILDLSKVEAGMITLQMEWMYVRSLIEEVNDLTSALAIDKGLELNYLITEDVPSMVRGDRFRIRQVLLNVVGNAIKFTQSGEVFVKCQLDDDPKTLLKSDETMLKFEIMDTGPGFNQKEAQFLFKRFSQIDSSSTKQHSGSGLGLAISIQLVELHGGNMWADSTVGKGSIFTFTAKFNIPLLQDQPPLPHDTPGTTEFHPPSDTRMSHEPTKEQLQGLSPFQPELNRKTSDPPSILEPDYDRTHQISVGSSGSSNPSIRTSCTSTTDLSSVSSIGSDAILSERSPPINLELPQGRHFPEQTATPSSSTSDSTAVPPSCSPSPRSWSPVQPSMYSILVACPLEHAREATVNHIHLTIPKSSPHHITARASFKDCMPFFDGDGLVLFTHVVLILHDTTEIVSFMDRLLQSPSYSATSIIIITDLAQRRDIMTKATKYDYTSLQNNRRLRFIFKPSKPSKFAIIFDPQKERQLSSDLNQDSAQAVAVSQKQVFDEMKMRLDGKGIRVLLVEDNMTNQMVSGHLPHIYDRSVEADYFH